MLVIHTGHGIAFAFAGVSTQKTKSGEVVHTRHQVKKDTFRWTPVFVVAGALFAMAILLMHVFPEERRLILVGLYSIPSHVFVTPFPQEPAVLYGAKYYSPWLVTAVMTAGGCLSAKLDYLFLTPVLTRDSVRAKFATSGLYQKLLTFFRLSPFWLLTIVNYAPIPLSPFKLLCIAEGYPLWKYEASLLVGRAPKYYTLALLGYVLQPPTSALITLVIVVVVLWFGHKMSRGFRAGVKRRHDGACSFTSHPLTEFSHESQSHCA